MYRDAHTLLLVLVLAAACHDAVPATPPVLGRRLDPLARCLEDAVSFGSAAAHGCDDSLTWAVDAAGQCFLFTNLCVPPAFTSIPGGDARCPAASAAIPTCASCAGLQARAAAEVTTAAASVQQCAADADCRPLDVALPPCLDCVQLAGNGAARSAVDADLAAIRSICAQFADAGCKVVHGGCPPVAGWACTDGKCKPR